MGTGERVAGAHPHSEVQWPHDDRPVVRIICEEVHPHADILVDAPVSGPVSGLRGLEERRDSNGPHRALAVPQLIIRRSRLGAGILHPRVCADAASVSFRRSGF